MKKTIKIAAIAAILFAITMYLFLQQQTITRSVVVAVKEMPVGTIVSEEMLRTELVPVTTLLMPGLASGIEEVVGKTVTIGRAAGDLIPLATVGTERKRPSEGKGFITVTVPARGAGGAVAGDIVSVVVFDALGGSHLLEDFLVVSRVVEDREAHLVLEADMDSLLVLVPSLPARSFAVIRR